MHAIYDGINRRSDGSHSLKLFTDTGALLLDLACRNESVASNAWRADAGCPPGRYYIEPALPNNVSAPSNAGNDWIGEGKWFVPIVGIPGHDGIGIHGGGTCVYPASLLDRQGWCPTMNCFRLQNADLERFVRAINGFTPLDFTVQQA